MTAPRACAIAVSAPPPAQRSAYSRALNNHMYYSRPTRTVTSVCACGTWEARPRFNARLDSLRTHVARRAPLLKCHGFNYPFHLSLKTPPARAQLAPCWRAPKALALEVVLQRGPVTEPGVVPPHRALPREGPGGMRRSDRPRWPAKHARLIFASVVSRMLQCLLASTCTITGIHVR